MTAEFDREKFKDAMHYVIARAGDHPGFGATKLYKILWFADARSFMLTGEPITGEEYVRQKFGPVPRHALPMRTALEQEQRVKIWEDRYINKPITRFKSLRIPNLTRFSKDEVGILNHWIRYVDEEHTATSISDESHDYGWEIAKMGETLPLHAFMASRWRDPTDEELSKARRRLGTLGL